MGNLSRLCTAAALAAGLAAAVAPAQAYTQSVLHTLCRNTGCSDGESPQFPRLQSGSVLYGVANGGAHSGGIVFSYNLGTSTYSVLYSFCATKSGSVCTDGEAPAGKLIIDTSGNLYGTTQLGGNLNNAGTVFELKKPVSGAWTLATLYQFCPDEEGDVSCADGDDPLSGLTYAGAASGTAYDGSSLLFGTTYVGGSDAEFSYGNGTVFALQKSGSAWNEKVIYAFCPACSESCTGCGDGTRPIGPFVMDASNNIWGSTITGGSDGKGTAYKLAAPANLWTGIWTPTVLYNFCWAKATKCTDGAYPSGVMLDAAGHVWGTTSQGGHGAGTVGDGVLFKLSSGSCLEFGGDGPFWCTQIKHSFCTSTGCTDGAIPADGIAMDASGTIFGTTGAGGSSAIVSGGAGTAWQYTAAGGLSVLYDFCATSSTCADGENPASGVILDGSGNLYGVTSEGGGTSQGALDGVIFELSP